MDPEASTEADYDYVWNRAYTRKNLVKYMDLSEFDWYKCNLSQHYNEDFVKLNKPSNRKALELGHNIVKDGGGARGNRFGNDKM